MESPLGLASVHWDHKPEGGEAAPPRCCRHLAGNAFVRLFRRQDAGSTLGFMARSNFTQRTSSPRQSPPPEVWIPNQVLVPAVPGCEICPPYLPALRPGP